MHIFYFLLEMSLALSLNPFCGFPPHPPPHLPDFLHLLSSAVPCFLAHALLYKSCAPNLGQSD